MSARIEPEEGVSTAMQIEVLGPLRVMDDGTPLALGGPRQQTVLAVLVALANETVSTDRLIDEIWGEEPPKAAKNSLQTMVSNLRKALLPSDGITIDRAGSGYSLRVPADSVDALSFAATLDEARLIVAEDPERAANRLRAALDSWRGQPYAGLADDVPVLAAEVTRLEGLRLRALGYRLEADLASGRHGEVIGELETLISSHPLHEEFYRLQMVALYRSGRQAEALRVFGQLRRTLGDELGITPSPDLQQLEMQILEQDSSLSAAPRRSTGEGIRGYEIRERVGEGAFGVVYRAFQPSIGRDVAIKVVRPELANDPEFIRRFDTEAQLVARLEHPHIAPLYDYWRDPDGAYLVMRWLGAGSLEQAMSRGPWNPDAAAAVIAQIGGALHFAHRKGVVHRDVKPANILLDADGHAYVTDFGIAVDIAGAQASDIIAEATMRDPYVSSEQRSGDRVSARSDVYSLGVVLWELLSGLRWQMNVAGRGPLSDIQPTLPTELSLVVDRATADDPAARYPSMESFVRALEEAVGTEPRTGATALISENPYRGLEAFQEADAGRFFGRQRLIQRLVERLAEPGPGSRFLCAIGPSGSGKSSVVRAGLVPALHAGALPGSEGWFVVQMVPGTSPMRELEAALLRVAVNPPATLLEQLGRDELGLRDAVERLLPVGSELVLVVDQFEELFTQAPREEADRFLDVLTGAAMAAQSRVRIVITLRADAFDKPLSHPEMAALLPARMETVVPLAPDELEQAVTAPASLAGVVVEPALVAAVVADATGQPGALPLVQYALTQLFDRRTDEAMSLEGYQAVGGVRGAIAGKADELYSGLDDDGREAARQLFLRLVTLGDGGQDTRRRVALSSLGSLPDARSVTGVIERFSEARLLSFDHEPTTRDPTVEVAHEALLTEWPRLREWIDENRADIRTERRLQAAAEEWDAAERADGYLLRADRLRDFSAWREQSSFAVTALQEDYLAASIDAEARERKAATRTKRRIIGAVAVAAVVAVVFGFVSWLDARRDARDAEARRLASLATQLVGSDPEVAALLALAAVEVSPIPEAEAALHRTVIDNRLVVALEAEGQAGTWVDDERVATLSKDGSINVYTLDGMLESTLGPVVIGDAGEEPPVLIASPDGAGLVAIGTPDGRILMWDLTVGRELWSAALGVATPSISWRPDGTEVGARAMNDDAQPLAIGGLYDARSGTQVLEFERCGCSPLVEFEAGGLAEPRLWTEVSPRDTGLLSVMAAYEQADSGWALVDPLESFTLHEGTSGSARATHIAAGTRFFITPSFVEDTVVVRASSDGRAMFTYRGHEGRAGPVDLSEFSTRVVSGGQDGTVHIWNRVGGTDAVELSGHRGAVVAVEFSPDDHHVLSVGADGSARVVSADELGATEVYGFSLTGGGFGAWFTGHGAESVPIVALTGDDRSDATLLDQLRSLLAGRVVPVDDGGDTTLGTLESYTYVAVHPVEPIAITTWPLADTPESGVVDLTDVRRLAEIVGRDTVGVGWAWRSYFNGTGDRLATTSTTEDLGTSFVSLFSFDTATRTAQLMDSVGPFGESPFDLVWDGSLIVSLASDGRVDVWDTDSGEVGSFHTVADATAIAARDGRIAVADGSGAWSLYESDGAVVFADKRGHTAGISSIEILPSRGLVATAGYDGNVVLWRLGTGERFFTLLSVPGERLQHIDVDEDEDRMVVLSRVGVGRVLTLDIDELIDIARSRVKRPLTEEECRLYAVTVGC